MDMPENMTIQLMAVTLNNIEDVAIKPARYAPTLLANIVAHQKQRPTR